jgi:SAM-dependent methyltransferase
MKQDYMKERFDSVDRSTTFQRIINCFDLSHKKVLDLGCGYGEHLAHFGKGSLGITTSHEEVEVGKKHSLDIIFGNAEFLEETHLPNDIDAVWANNLFEHILSPHALLMKLKKHTVSNGLLILGVPVIPKIATLISSRHFSGVLASNHINFFTKETLVLTVERAGWRVCEVRPFWSSSTSADRLFNKIAPHLYVVARNDSEFKYPDKKYREWIADKHYRYLFDITNQNNDSYSPL